jgi:hypothetical protein
MYKVAPRYLLCFKHHRARTAPPYTRSMSLAGCCAVQAVSTRSTRISVKPIASKTFRLSSGSLKHRRRSSAHCPPEPYDCDGRDAPARVWRTFFDLPLPLLALRYGMTAPSGHYLATTAFLNHRLSKAHSHTMATQSHRGQYDLVGLLLLAVGEALVQFGPSGFDLLQRIETR